MKYSELKTIRTFCEQLHSEPDWREVVENITNGETDFEVNNVRFINDDSILEILADELGSDEYVLGAFNASFLADVTGLPLIVFEALQKADAYQAAGEIVIALNKLEELAEAYASADGYGHHFNLYDFYEQELQCNDQLFHVFDNR